MVQIKSVKQFNEEINSNEKVIVDFNAVWCGPCKMQHEILEEIEEKFKDIKILLVDVDKMPELAAKFNINSIPTLHNYKNGKLIKERIGFTSIDVLSNF